MSSVLAVIVVASALALLFGLAHFAWRTWLLRRARAAEAYQAVYREALGLLERYGHRMRGEQDHFELGQVPVELRRTLLDGLEVLAAHARQHPDDDEGLYSPVGQLAELESALELVRTIAEDRVSEQGRQALRSLFVDTMFRQLHTAIGALEPGSSLPSSQAAELRDQVLPAAREALSWEQDGTTVRRAELRTLVEDAQGLLQEPRTDE
jgi:hypothetical protein